MNVVVLVFALAISIAVGVAVGLVPAFRFSRVDLQTSLRGGSARGGDTASILRLRGALVVAEMSLALIVLVMSGLLIRTIIAIDQVPIGLRATNVLTFQASLPTAQYDSAYKRAAFLDRAQRALGSMPGVTLASGVNPLPMSHDGWSGSINVETEPTPPNGEPPHAAYAVALPNYFRTLSIPLIAGRDFTDRDVRGADAVAIVDEAFAQKHWPSRPAIGQRISPSGATGPWATVVGVVGHVRRDGPLDAGEPQIYFPALQWGQSGLYFVVSGPHALTLSSSVRATMRSLDRLVPIAKLQPMDELVSGAVARQRFNSLLFMMFGAAAVTLAAIGLYGVMGYLVSQRRQEIGIRLALGGSRESVVGLVLRQGLTMAVLGVGLGLIGAVFATRLVAPMLFGVGAQDWVTFAAITALLIGVAVAATLGPALRAARTNPTEAIRG